MARRSDWHICIASDFGAGYAACQGASGVTGLLFVLLIFLENEAVKLSVLRYAGNRKGLKKLMFLTRWICREGSIVIH